MTAVALIGGDGAGKTTIAEHLVTSGDIRATRLYMGMSAQSGDHLLPTSRLVLWLKRRAYRRRARQQLRPGPVPTRIPAEFNEYAEHDDGPLRVTARLLNRFAEAWYRHLWSLSYQVRDLVVIYDRHVLFDMGVLDPDASRPRWLAERIFRKVMRATFPRPDAVIYLETSGQVLHGRKGEATIEYLDREARMYLAQSSAVERFERVDASQPLDDVKREVTQIVADLVHRAQG